jgi:hypothetical protein
MLSYCALNLLISHELYMSHYIITGSMEDNFHCIINFSFYSYEQVSGALLAVEMSLYFNCLYQVTQISIAI